MLARQVRGSLVEPAAGGVNDPGWIHFFQDFIVLQGMELSPAFVEDRPKTDRRDVAEEFDGFPHFLAEGFPRILGVPSETAEVFHIGKPLQAERREGSHLPEGIAAAVHHVLPDDHPQPVAVVIETERLDLDVLSERVETERLHGEDVVDVGLVGSGSVEAVAEKALIQNSVKEIRFVVQEKAFSIGAVPD